MLNREVTLELRSGDDRILLVNGRKVLKRFWRASTAKRRNIAGIGLGLYISSQIISQHQGKMWLKSEKDQGSTVSFAIPLSPGGT